MPQMLEKTLSEQFVEEFCHRIIKGEWVTPGQRLRGPIRSGEGQLRKFAARNLPTIICLLDTTVGRFLAEDFHIRAAMYGVETLHFAVSPTTGTGPFLGSTPGKNAMLRRDERTTVSAVAVLRHPPGSEMVVDLYHNQFAAIPIEPGTAAPFVRQQFGVGIDAPKKVGPTFDELKTHQPTPFNDQCGIYLINAGSRGALRDSLTKALLYAYEAALQGNNPTSIVGVGTSERLDAFAILQGWRELGLRLPVA
jgi:hypothetical protein